MKSVKFKLLSGKQHKADKAVEYGYFQGILQLQPCTRLSATVQARLTAAGFRKVKCNICPYAGLCKRSCLEHTGYNSAVLNKNGKSARQRRTEQLSDNPILFLNILRADLAKLVEVAESEDLKPVCRLNGLSDLFWPLDLFYDFPQIQFLDYTKDLDKALDAAVNPAWPSNYHLTYSWNERSESEPRIKELFEYIQRRNRVNIAVVFDSKQLPESVNLLGNNYRVIDGDLSDLRFLDKSGAVVGLRFKQPLIHGGFKRPRQFNKFVLPVE